MRNGESYLIGEWLNPYIHYFSIINVKNIPSHSHLWYIKSKMPILNFRSKSFINWDSPRHPSKLIKFCLHWSMPSAGSSQPPIPQIAPNIVNAFSGLWPNLFSNSNHCSNSSFIFACPFGQCHSNRSNSIASDGRTSRHKRMPKNW